MSASLSTKAASHRSKRARCHNRVMIATTFWCRRYRICTAGLAELRGPSADDFWSWRDVMYRFALSMTPEQVEAITSQVYVEMLEAGFCRVGEFHYLHHDIDGRPYQNVGEMAGASLLRLI